ncbi:MAG: FAD:protein FMN transferase [Gallionella sp.]|nr:FAD:protein FMN transferase [Gallionella sp.]
MIFSLSFPRRREFSQIENSRVAGLSGFIRRMGMKARHGLRFAFLFGLLTLSGCGKEPLYQEQGYVFGTLVEVSIYGETEPRARQAVADVLHEFQRLHDLLHAWQPSELSDLNTAISQGKNKVVSPELAYILRDAASVSQQSQGLFNPAIGGLAQLWGFHADEFKPVQPDNKLIAQWVASNPQMSDLVFLPAPSGMPGKLVRSNNKAVQIDLGGYAKGYALERAADLLRKRGMHNALINVGGNILALGQHGKRAWRVGIQHPRKSGALATLALHDGEAIGTSGDYQRYFMLGNTRYCHLIDPRNGYPMQGVQAVTILIKPPAIQPGEQGMLAEPLLMTRRIHAGVLSDVASKPLFIAGANGWRAEAVRMELDEAMLVDGQGRIHLTGAFQKRLEFADKEVKLQLE